MHLEKTIPFTWKSWDEVDQLVHSYYDVEFTEDFGSFKKGEKFSAMTVDYGLGKIEVYNNEGTNIVKKQNYKTIPID